jgi:hypothetical protein
MLRSERCQVNFGPNDESLSVWIFWIAKGEMLPNLVQELDRCLSVVVVVDAQNTKPSRFVDGCELVEALPSAPDSRNEFHIELYRTAWYLQWGVSRLRAWAEFLLGDRAHVVTMKELVNGGRRDVSMIVPLQVQAGSDGFVTAFFTNPQDQGNDLRRDPIPNMVRPSFEVAKTCYAVLFVTFLPDVEERPRDSEEP